MLKDKIKMYARLKKIIIGFNHKVGCSSKQGGVGIKTKGGIGLKGETEARCWAQGGSCRFRPVQRLNRFGLIVYICVEPVFFIFNTSFSLLLLFLS